MKAPFKRGQLLNYTGIDFPHGTVKYVKWWGIQRAALMIVKLADGRQVIFLDDGVQVAPPSWGGSVFSDTLYDALKEARQSVDE